MKKSMMIFFTNLFLSSVLLAQGKLLTRTGHAVLFSHTVAEDISANNYEVSGTIDPVSGEIAISVPVQSFQFEKALMQEHFNSPNFMDSKQFPRIIFKGKIDDPSSVSYKVNGKYEVTVSGNLTIKGTTKTISTKATIEVKDGKILVSNSFFVTGIGSYGVGKPKGSKKGNVADDIKVTYNAEYSLFEN